MSYSRRYSRVFITLKQDRADLSADNRSAVGRCIIELRNGEGKLSALVQGLKPQRLYRINLIAPAKNESLGVPLGLIRLDDNGKGELTVGFNPDNVAGSGKPVEAFSAAAVLAEGMGEAAAALVGYVDKSFIWKSNFRQFSLKDEEKADSSIAAAEKADSNIAAAEKAGSDIAAFKKTDSDIAAFKKTDSDIAAAEETAEQPTANTEDGNSEMEKMPDIEDKLDDIAALDKNKELTAELPKAEQEILKVSSEIEQEKSFEESKKLQEQNEDNADMEDGAFDFMEMLQKFKKDMLELERYTYLTRSEAEDTNKKPLPAAVGDVSYIRKNNPEMKPFDNDNSGCRWFRIAPYELALLAGDLWQYAENPFVVLNYKKFKHLLLGFPDIENGSCIIAVPARFSEAPEGFTSFKGCNGKPLEEGDYGYWLLGAQYNIDNKDR